MPKYQKNFLIRLSNECTCICNKFHSILDKTFLGTGLIHVKDFWPFYDSIIWEQNKSSFNDKHASLFSYDSHIPFVPHY